MQTKQRRLWGGLLGMAVLGVGLMARGDGITLLHSFGVSDGAGSPSGSLILSGSTFYGTTDWCVTYCGGVIFKMNIDGGGFTVLHSFSAGTHPGRSLTLNNAGTTLYGMTRFGGTNGLGEIFKINTDGSGFSQLHSFAGWLHSDGAEPLMSFAKYSDMKTRVFLNKMTTMAVTQLCNAH